MDPHCASLHAGYGIRDERHGRPQTKTLRWRMEGAVAVISLDRPERKNPLTFESYAELRDTFRALPDADDVKAVVFGPNGGNFFLPAATCTTSSVRLSAWT